MKKNKALKNNCRFSFGIFLTLFAIASLTIISSCQTTINVATFNPRSGTNGVELTMIQNAPPASIYESTSFMLGFDLWNLGGYNSNGKYSIIYDKSYLFFKTESEFFNELLGKSLDNPAGQKTLVKLAGNSLPLPSQLETISLPIIINLCYRYQTLATPTVCIDTDAYGQVSTANKPCAVQPVSLSGGQGAPVAVTNVVPSMVVASANSVKPEFTITLKNAGRGTVVRQDSVFSACSSQGIAKGETDVASVSVTMSNRQLKCAPENAIFIGGTATIVCSPEEPIESRFGTYPALLSIDIQYGYSMTVAQQISINRKTVA